MSISLHTSHGVIKVEIFCDKVPRTSENFLALAASGFYDNTVFHRNMKGFMLQGGDPSGGGKGTVFLPLELSMGCNGCLITCLYVGGECIWGGVFEDEFRDELRYVTAIVIVLVFLLYYMLSLGMTNVVCFQWQTMRPIQMALNFSSYIVRSHI